MPLRFFASPLLELGMSEEAARLIKLLSILALLSLPLRNTALI